VDKPWMKYINVDNLPNEDLKIVASVIGIDPTIKIMCELPGILISVPKNATLPAKIKYILNTYDGSKKSRFELARTCGLSESYIYRIARQRIIK
jgi:hypothetical protein